MTIQKTLWSLLAMSLLTAAPAAERPNIVLIFADDMGWGDVGYHGFDDVITPDIDRIANEGVQFRQGYVSASVCGPSRAGLMTGGYKNAQMPRTLAGGRPRGLATPDWHRPTGQGLGLRTV